MKHVIQRRRREDEGGFAVLMIFVLAAAIGISLYMEMPRVTFESQRQRELLTVMRGHEYERAIQLYYRKLGRYPTKLEDLENTNNIRFLRAKYKDPLTGKDDWRLVHVGPGGMLTDSLVQKAQNPLGGDSKDGKDNKDQTTAQNATGQTPPPTRMLRRGPSILGKRSARAILWRSSSLRLEARVIQDSQIRTKTIQANSRIPGRLQRSPGSPDSPDSSPIRDNRANLGSLSIPDNQDTQRSRDNLGSLFTLDNPDTQPSRANLGSPFIRDNPDTQPSRANPSFRANPDIQHNLASPARFPDNRGHHFSLASLFIPDNRAIRQTRRSRDSLCIPASPDTRLQCRTSRDSRGSLRTIRISPSIPISLTPSPSRAALRLRAVLSRIYRARSRTPFSDPAGGRLRRLREAPAAQTERTVLAAWESQV